MEANYKKCIVCGKRFRCPASDKTVTCSKGCSAIHRSNIHKGKSNVWGEEGRKRKSRQGMTENLLKGTLAAKESPKAGHFVTNANAKKWHIVSPEGKAYHFKNLSLWAENNYGLFDFTDPEDARKVMGGIKQAKRAVMGKKGARVCTYKGWQIIAEGQPEERQKEEGQCHTMKNRSNIQ